MKTILEDQDYSAGAYVSFSPIPVSPKASGPISPTGLAILFFLGGIAAILAAVISTRPYQIEAKQARDQAEIAVKQASAAKAELNRVRRCVAGGQQS